ncbi:hypothetical protein L596_014535 [Steinernema carpocapsae]|uniref:Uncharacterized protein n=1 Tax=Steinernema carpocapsae TaxID=34508 RepID=A0A4V6XW75_STECR|nr:hypothetical protein L596_014535 [Steinernema carpocapsae]
MTTEGCFISSQIERHNASVMKVLNWNVAYTTEDIDSTKMFYGRPRGSTFHETTEVPSNYSCSECFESSTPKDLHFCFTCIDRATQDTTICDLCLKKSHFGHSHCSLPKAPKELRRRMAAESSNNLKMVDSLILSKLVARFKTHMTRYREEFRSQIAQEREEELYLKTSDVQTELKQLRTLRNDVEEEMRKLREACREFDRFINSKFPCE